MKTLTITVDVSDLTEEQVNDLAAEMEAQAEATEGRPDAEVISRTVA